jgi:hypothetical protein
MKSLIPFLLLTTACGTNGKKLQFEMTSDEALKQVVRDIELGSELDAWLRKVSSACNAKAPSCPSMIIADLEKKDYQNDSSPEYLMYDAFMERLTSPEYGITILERDQDVLAVMEMDKNGVKLPTSMEPEDTTEGDDFTPEDRLAMAGTFLEEITSILAAQDVLLFEKKDCCNADGTLRPDFDATSIIANEVGERKSELLQDLVKEYLALFPKTKPNDIPQEVIDVKVADYMLAYRLYKFDNTLDTSGVGTERTTTLQMHVRIIDMNTGEIIVSDFLSNEMIESLKMFEKKEKEKKTKEKRTYSPYVSYGGGLTVANPKGVDTAMMASPGVYGEYNYFTKKAYRLTTRAGLNYSQDDINALKTDYIGQYYQQQAWQMGGQVTFDKVIGYNRPLQVFGGIGVDFGYGSLSYTQIERDEDNEATIGKPDGDKAFGIDILAGGGITYNINNLGLKAGYVMPVYELSTGAPAQETPTVHLGLTFSTCGAPSWSERGNACTENSLD